MLLGHAKTYKDLAPYGGDRPGRKPTFKLPSSGEESTGGGGTFCVGPRAALDPELKAMSVELQQQDKRLDAMTDALEAKGDFYEDIRSGMDDMKDELQRIQALAGQQKARVNVKRATQAVLHLTDTFDQLDLNSSGAIDVAELRRGLHLLGMDSHSAQANAIIERYTHDMTVDIKVFATLVKDIHTLLTFDVDGSGTLDAEELKPALAQLGLSPSDRNIEKIARAWDADNSGKLDLLEFTDLVRTLQTFMKYDKDGSGDIDVGELRPALRRLGIPADTATANAILKWYDHDASGKIELHEFAVLARDASVFAAYDKDHSGELDAEELLPALGKLGLAASEDEVRQIILTWDDNNTGQINLLEFAEIIRDLQVFEQFDVDRSGFISTAELRIALSKLGVQMSHPETQNLLDEYDEDKSGTIEFSEFRRLAEDLPSIVGRERDSFFKMHRSESAYVHSEDVLDDELHIDLDQSFVKSMSKKGTRGSMNQRGGGGGGGSVLGSPAVLAPQPSVLGGLGTAAAPLEWGGGGGGNAFDSRLLGGGGRGGGGGGSMVERQGKRDSVRDVRAVRLANSEKPTFHQSKSMLRD